MEPFSLDINKLTHIENYQKKADDNKTPNTSSRYNDPE